ncbi:MAG: DUF3365 domain-containing protein [Cytophagales bacterium]|nr:DUF3365 domain-containing protein [Cytophagales bacterium]
MVAIVVSCDKKRLDTAEIADEMKDRRVRKISQSKILEVAQKKGNIAVIAIDKAFKSKMERELKGSEPDSAFRYCAIEKFSTTDSLAYILKAKIVRHGRTVKPVAPEEQAYTFQLLDAYRYNAENKIPSEDNMQNIKESVILYTKPIMLSEQLCKKCHGMENEVGSKRLVLLKKKYPTSPMWELTSDSLLGMWAISFDKKELIRNIK